MAVCHNCGHAVSSGARFCKSCGTPVAQAKQPGLQAQHVQDVQPGTIPNGDAPASAPTAAPLRAASAPAARRSNRKLWAALIAAAAAVIVLAGGYLVGAYLTSGDRLADNLEKVLKNRDGKALAEMLSADDERLVLNEQSTRGFMKYIEAHPDAVQAIIDGLDDEEAGHRMIRLTKSGGFLFYNKYKLTVEPVFLTISTNHKDAALYIDGKQVAEAAEPNEEQQFGPYLPGTYELEAKLKTDFIELSKKVAADAWGGENNYSAELGLDGSDVTIETGMEQSGVKGRLLINGQPVDGIDPFETTTFGPLLTDGSMKIAVEADMPWGTMKSNETAIDSASIKLSLTDNDAFRNGLIDIVSKYNREELAAKTSGLINKITTAAPEQLAVVQQRIDDSKKEQRTIISTYKSAKFDMDSFRLSNRQGKWHVSMLLIATYDSADYPAGTTPFPPSEDPQGQTLQLVYNGQKKAWQVESKLVFYDGYDFSDNLKEIVEKNPVEYKTAAPENADVPSSAADTDIAAMQVFMTSYIASSVQAINDRNFDQVAPLLDPAGPAYEESSSYIDYLEGKGITEEALGVTVDQVKLLDDRTYQVSTRESYNIIYADGTVKLKSYKSVYKVVKIDNALHVHQLISTKEQ